MLGIMFTDTVRVLKAQLWLRAFGNLNYKQRSVSVPVAVARSRERAAGEDLQA